MIDATMAGIADELATGKRASIGFEEAEALEALPQARLPELLDCSQRVTEAFKEWTIFSCQVCNAKSGRCSQDCAFCAQSIHHGGSSPEYPLQSPLALLDTAKAAQDCGATFFSIVTSGGSLDTEELAQVCQAVSFIRSQTELSVCASLGELSPAMAESLAESGLQTYHHNLETAESYFPSICGTHSYADRVRTLEAAKEAGLSVCSGGVLGLGESPEQRLELAFQLRDLSVDCIPLNFLDPRPGTPLASRPLLQPQEALKAIALFRLINPDRDITICGGREKILNVRQHLVFRAGANGLMIGSYLTTSGQSAFDDLEMIRAEGRQVLRGAKDLSPAQDSPSAGGFV